MSARISRIPRKPRIPLILTFAVLTGLVATILPMPGISAPAAPPAQAAELGHHVSINGWALGTFLSTQENAYVYCLEPGASYPGGDQRNPDWVDKLPGYTATTSGNVTGWTGGTVTSGPATGETLRRMNYVIETHGNTTNPERAAAVQLALWMLRDDPGLRAWLAHHVNWIQQAGYGGIVTAASNHAAEARSRALPPATPTPNPLELTQGPVHGEGTIEYPAGTTKLSISGGTFENGDRSVQITDEAAGTVAWKADLHPNGWQRLHEVAVDGEWSIETRGWAAALKLHPPVDASQQMLGTGVGMVTEIQTGGFGEVRTEVDAQFSPVLTTQVPDPFVERGEGAFSDTVTLGVADTSAPWAERTISAGEQEFAPVVAQGTLYGPFTYPQRPADGPPAGAPVAAHAEFVADRGPGEYEVQSDDRPDEAGYYSWVWSIRESVQQEEVREANLIPTDYNFSDRFGLTEEGQTVPTSLRWTTDLLEREITLDDMTLRDTVTPTLAHGAWLRDEEGERHTAQLRLTVYQTDERPKQQRTPPAHAREVTSSLVAVNAPEQTVTVDPIPIPFETRGWVTVQTCLYSEDQDEETIGHFEEWCDDFGVPAESAKIAPPEVRTEAQGTALVDEMIRDTAIVTGVVPEESEISFEFFLHPEVGAFKYDENWSVRQDSEGNPLQWTAAELRELSEDERCLVQPVAQTDSVSVEEAGKVPSPLVRAQSTGTGYWVETLITKHSETTETVELHRGACGLENERTIIQDEDEPALATTGGSVTPILAGGAALALVGLVLTLMAGARLRRRGSA